MSIIKPSIRQIFNIILNLFQTKIFLENVNITSPCSSYQYSRVLPAQKLAPNISKSSKVDYTKLYEASTSKDNTNKCETLSMISTKRKSFLDDLENSNVIITVYISNIL